METHHHHHYCQGTTFLGHLPRPPQPLYSPHPWRPFSTKPISHSRISFSSNNFPRWNSNDETFRPPNFNFNNARTTSQEEDEEEEYDDDEFGKKRRWWSDEYTEETEEEGNSGILEDALDSLWILKVFKSYGWTLPIILASWLLSTGPKAFLMALAIPLGQSALALAFEKLWGRTESKPKRKYRMKRKRRNVNDSRVEEEPEENQKTNTRKTGMQSWVVENNGSVDSGSRDAPSFGGWDDSERARPTTRRSQARKGSQRMNVEGGRLSRRERKSDTPLLVRLLIAIFPFLGTWTKML
uniref:Transmembrane protein n=1 Tax=Medicago truncatula TaxID=3880 RepID=I3T856_MEDTR|nr:unknown [Medicago truncatula]